MNLNHLHLGSKEVKTSQKFYENYFGFKKKFDHGEGVFLVNEDNFLLAIDPVDNIPTLPEWFHIGFCLDNPQQVSNLCNKMKNDEVNFARELASEDEKFISFIVTDPDGYKVEVSWHSN